MLQCFNARSDTIKGVRRYGSGFSAAGKNILLALLVSNLTSFFFTGCNYHIIAYIGDFQNSQYM